MGELFLLVIIVIFVLVFFIIPAGLVVYMIFSEWLDRRPTKRKKK